MTWLNGGCEIVMIWINHPYDDLPARAFMEIQLASRWDSTLAVGLKKTMATITALTTGKVVEVAERHAMRDVPGLLNEFYFLISATQGLALGRDLVDDKAMVTASLAILKDRFATAIKERLAPPTDTRVE